MLVISQPLTARILRLLLGDLHFHDMIIFKLLWLLLKGLAVLCTIFNITWRAFVAAVHAQ